MPVQPGHTHTWTVSTRVCSRAARSDPERRKTMELCISVVQLLPHDVCVCGVKNPSSDVQKARKNVIFGSGDESNGDDNDFSSNVCEGTMLML